MFHNSKIDSCRRQHVQEMVWGWLGMALGHYFICMGATGWDDTGPNQLRYIVDQIVVYFIHNKILPLMV